MVAHARLPLPPGLAKLKPQMRNAAVAYILAAKFRAKLAKPNIPVSKESASPPTDGSAGPISNNN